MGEFPCLQKSQFKFEGIQLNDFFSWTPPFSEMVSRKYMQNVN